MNFVHDEVSFEAIWLIRSYLVDILVKYIKKGKKKLVEPAEVSLDSTQPMFLSTLC